MQSRTDTLKRFTVDALHSNGHGINTYEEEIDLSAGDVDFYFRDSILSSKIVSIQLVWEGLTGVLDAVVEMIQSSTGEDEMWDLCGCTATLTDAAESVTLEKYPFGGRFAGIRFIANGVTGGTLKKIVLIAKD